jgi:peptide/nickel transport system permease protein
MRSRLLRNRRVTFGVAVLAALVVVAMLAPWLAPHDPTEQDLLSTLTAPAWMGGQRTFFFGTDSLGRDILSRLIYGARVALMVAVVAATLAGLLGTALGLRCWLSRRLGGQRHIAPGRYLDELPAVLLSIVLAAVLGCRSAHRDHRHRGHRLDTVLPCCARGGAGAARAGLCRFGNHHRA